MKTGIKQFIFAGVLSFAGFIANGQQMDTTSQVHNFTVEDAVKFALKNSVQVRNALVDLRIQEQSNKEITAQALPQINASGSLTDYLDIPTSLIPAEFTGGLAGTYIPIQFGTKYNATGGISVTQILFDGQVFVGLQARSTSLQFYSKQAEVTQESIKVNVMKIYYQLVVGRQQLTTVQANIDRFEKLLHDTREMYKQGFAEQLDVDKVNVQLINLQTTKVKTQNQLDAGNASLKFLMNMPQKDKLVLVDSLTQESLKENLLAENYQYADRKDYQLLQLNRKLNEFNIRRYKLSYLPTLSANGNYAVNAQRQKFDFFKGGPWYKTSLIGLSLQVPIFDGFAKRARINQAKLALEKTDNNIEQLMASIDNDIKQSSLNITSALVTMDAQKKNMELAERVYNSTKLKYEQGLGSNQEISTAQADLVTAQNNYYSSLYDAIIAKIDYEKAAGKL
ncbi:MAG TPA: TolC family protein [Hanamia sp.]|nr:TolC family protein [Hanamia sp.]